MINTSEFVSKAVRDETLRQFELSLPHWHNLKSSRILMTGCSGLFGLWLLDLVTVANRELGMGIQVGVLTRSAARFYERFSHLEKTPGLTLIEGDVRTFELKGFEPTHLIHGATTSAAETFRGEGPLQKFDTLVSGTNRVFLQLPRGSVKAALFLSSGAVYGPPPVDTEGIKESQLIAPLPEDVTAALGHAKRAAEFLCHAHAANQRIPLRVARCFAFSGAGIPLDLHYALGDFIRQASNSNEIVIKGDGLAIRSYMHLGDLAIWLICLLSNEDRSKPAVVNVGSPRSISIRDLASEVSTLFESRAKIIIKGKEDYSVGNPIRSKYVPCTKLANSYGLRDWTPLRHSLKNMIAGSGFNL
jgi:UDP-glucuronate decarboxylase